MFLKLDLCWFWLIICANKNFLSRILLNRSDHVWTWWNVMKLCETFVFVLVICDTIMILCHFQPFRALEPMRIEAVYQHWQTENLKNTSKCQINIHNLFLFRFDYTASHALHIGCTDFTFKRFFIIFFWKHVKSTETNKKESNKMEEEYEVEKIMGKRITADGQVIICRYLFHYVCSWTISDVNSSIPGPKRTKFR